MTRLGTISLIAGGLILLSGQNALRAESTNAAPQFKEVYDLVRAHLPGITDAELNRAAVEGLLASLGSRVALVSESSSEKSGSSLVSRTNVFENAIAYLRVGGVEEGLGPALRGAYDAMAANRELKGVVLDLRYAGGGNYAAAADAGDLFLKQERPLLDWGQGVARSKAKADAVSVPVAVLVNRQTSGAAEALAAVLRETGAGLILGGKTAGEAMGGREYPLANGQRLRIAETPVKLGNGSAISSRGLQPDISVQVSAPDERAYFADAFKVVSRPNPAAGVALSATNPASVGARNGRHVRFNEAELVRERKEGINPDLEPEPEPTLESEPEKAVVADPALARALDVLKGLAVVRRARS
jgi:hypothetical protein